MDKTQENRIVFMLEREGMRVERESDGKEMSYEYRCVERESDGMGVSYEYRCVGRERDHKDMEYMRGMLSHIIRS